MSSTPPTPPADEQARELQTSLTVAGVIAVLVLLGLISLGVFLALTADTSGPSVAVVRDMVIVMIALEMLVIGVALTVLLVQIARFVNLINTEVQPLIQATADTVNTVRGTAQFLSKHLTEPVMQASSALSGLTKVAQDVEAIRAAAGIIASAAVVQNAPAAAPAPEATGTASQPEESKSVDSAPLPAEAPAPARKPRTRKKKQSDSSEPTQEA